mmetsp:Transcript_22836/g.58150  ORF Transcript_22836/g.58150 Transcript_22836/m.58150 type:complete len:205 (+) Transcript_22836:2047-2661(+)
MSLCPGQPSAEQWRCDASQSHVHTWPHQVASREQQDKHLLAHIAPSNPNMRHDQPAPSNSQWLIASGWGCPNESCRKASGGATRPGARLAHSSLHNDSNAHESTKCVLHHLSVASNRMFLGSMCRTEWCSQSRKHPRAQRPKQAGLAHQAGSGCSQVCVTQRPGKNPQPSGHPEAPPPSYHQSQAGEGRVRGRWRTPGQHRCRC